MPENRQCVDFMTRLFPLESHKLADFCNLASLCRASSTSGRPGSASIQRGEEYLEVLDGFGLVSLN
jgi:hypothetical protein